MSGRARFDVRRIDLNLLVSLHYLLEECHVTAAAERMAVSQPSMSAALGRLRRLLGDPLLVRVGRGLVLTPYAEGLRDAVGAVLQDVELVLSTRPTFDPVAESREFSVAATDYLTFILLTGLASKLGAASSTRIQVRPVDDTSVDDLRSNAVDLLLSPRESMSDVTDLVAASLFRDTFVGVRRRGEPGPAPTDSTSWAQRPFVAYRGRGASSHIERQLEEGGLVPDVRLTAPSIVAIPLMVSESDLVALVYERLATRMSALLPLEVFAPPVPVAPVTQAVYWHPRRTDDPAHRWLREQVIRYGRSLN